MRESQVVPKPARKPSSAGLPRVLRFPHGVVYRVAVSRWPLRKGGCYADGVMDRAHHAILLAGRDAKGRALSRARHRQTLYHEAAHVVLDLYLPGIPEAHDEALAERAAPAFARAAQQIEAARIGTALLRRKK
jgi:hypothetical protein